jgi:hypothetical protein
MYQRRQSFKKSLLVKLVCWQKLLSSWPMPLFDTDQAKSVIIRAIEPMRLDI